MSVGYICGGSRDSANWGHIVGGSSGSCSECTEIPGSVSSDDRDCCEGVSFVVLVLMNLMMELSLLS